jgi:hypothetical protein
MSEIHSQDFATISTYLQNPTISEASEAAVNVAVRRVRFTTTRENRALGLQVLQTLLVLAIDNARTPCGPAACKRMKMVSIQKD